MMHKFTASWYQFGMVCVAHQNFANHQLGYWEEPPRE